ncbi:MAG: tRNA (N(6)-L-threonylcarbamoyladenosine(37)-C(2))-methylthiotransferase [Thermoprotei archaeon]
MGALIDSNISKGEGGGGDGRAGRISFRVYGCTMNRADMLAAREYVGSHGYRVVDCEDEADTVVVYSCSVRNETEEGIITHVRRLQAMGKRVVVTSCLANTRPARILTDAPGSIVLIGGDSEQIVDALEAEAGRVVYGSTRLPTPKSNSLVYPVKIAEGCTSNCYFCVTKLARPKLWCRPSEEIVGAVRSAVGAGAVEVELTSMDNADYYEPPNTRIAQLVDKIVRSVRGRYMLRVGMMNPMGALKMKEDLASMLSHPKVYRFLHIPIQSPDPGVLRSMNRHYTPEEVVGFVLELKQRVPELRVATDIMVGYPGESGEAFEKTLEVIGSGVFDKLHVFRFTPRPHTKAASLKQVAENEKKKRTLAASAEARRVQLEKNQVYVGRVLEALVTGSDDKATEARTTNYIKVRLPYTPHIHGEWVRVHVTGATADHLVGVLAG